MSCNGLSHDDTCECTREAVVKKLDRAEFRFAELQQKYISVVDKYDAAADKVLELSESISKYMDICEELSERASSAITEEKRVTRLAAELTAENVRLRGYIEQLIEGRPFNKDWAILTLLGVGVARQDSAPLFKDEKLTQEDIALLRMAKPKSAQGVPYCDDCDDCGDCKCRWLCHCCKWFRNESEYRKHLAVDHGVQSEEDSAK